MPSGRKRSVGHDPGVGGGGGGGGSGSYVNKDYHQSNDSLDCPRFIRSDGMTDVPLDDMPRSYSRADSVSKPTSPSSAASDVTSATVPLTPNLARRLGERRPTLTDMRQQLSDATSVAGRAITAGAKQGLKTLTKPMELSTFGWFDILTALVSIVMFYFDVISDSLVAFYMHKDPATEDWFIPTVLLLVIPLTVVNGFSLYWYWFDERVCESEGMCYRSPKASSGVWAFRIIAHLLLQASVLRYCDLLYYGRKSLKTSSSSESPPEEENPKDPRNGHQIQQHKANDPANGYSSISPAPLPSTTSPTYQHLWIHAERDAANVDLLAALVQDAPQLILQLYIMAHTLPEQALQGEISNTLMVQLLSVCGSLIAMAWSVGSFSRATRLAEPSLGNLSPAGLIVLTLAHFCSIGPQVLCFALFSTKYLVVFMVVVSCHWLTSSVLVLFTLVCCPNPIRMGATFTHDMRDGPCHRLDDIFFSAAFGMILLYTFVDVGGTAPKITGGVFHILRLLEEACMIAFWYLGTEGESWYHWLPLVLVSSFFILSILFSSLYFLVVYPDRHRGQSTA